MMKPVAKRVHRVMRTLAVGQLVMLTVVAPACDDVALDDVCKDVGLCDVPPPEPEEFAVVLDGSPGSTASLATVEPVVRAVLGRAIERPGSVIRVWTVGTAPNDSREVAHVEVPAPPRRLRNPRAHRTEVTAQLREDLVPAIATTLETASTQQRSAIADALTLGARTPSQGSQRWLVTVSDLREMTGPTGLDLECPRELPTAERFSRYLSRRGLLGPGTLDGYDVILLDLGLPPFPGRRRCDLSVRRSDELAALWTAVLQSAGARSVEVAHGAVRFPESASEDPAR